MEETGTSNPNSDSNSAGTRNLRQRSGIYYGIYDMSSDDELDSQKPEKENTSKASKQNSDSTTSSTEKPKRGKYSSKWKPEEAKLYRPQIEDAPVFHPTEEEFQDTLGYIAKIRVEANKFGICKIIPPSSWTPPCPLKDDNFYKRVEFTTRLQEVNKLQNRKPVKKRSKTQMRKKRRKGLTFGMHKRRNVGNDSKVKNENNLENNNNNECGSDSDSDEKFGFQTGSDFTLEAFEKFADKFKKKHFRSNNKNIKNNGDNNNSKKECCGPSVEEIEGEYWRIVEKGDKNIEVHYGADLDTASFGSGFPKITSPNPDSKSNLNELQKYELSGWNLNNLPRLPQSILSLENEEISGVLVPWLYIGMCFSSFCWHVEDHHLYSLNYMHFGEPKVWYGVSCTDADKLEETMRKKLPHLFQDQPSLLHELVTQLSPTVLKSEGVPVYRLVQRPGEFVLTFPRAYHSGFNCGFNCAEAVNVAPSDWLPHGMVAIENYRLQSRKTSISNDKLLLATSEECMKEFCTDLLCGQHDAKYRFRSACGKGGYLTVAMKVRFELEKRLRESLNPEYRTKILEKGCDLLNEKECFACLYDLYLSGCVCECNPTRYACLWHAHLLCSCEPRNKNVLFRMPLEQLGIIASALEGDSTAIKTCLKVDSARLNSQEQEISETRIKSEKDKESGGKSSSVVFGVDLGQCQSQSRIQSGMIEVELVEIGSVVEGDGWSCTEAIYTKGFKSKVKFLNVLKPSEICTYISEVFVCEGMSRPLFRVSLEERPDVAFSQVSPNLVWKLVLSNIHLTVPSRPPYPESINGFKMFGYLSPPIIQALEARDPNHTCRNYWVSRDMGTNPNSSSAEIETDRSALRSLFNKASLEELKVMYEVLASGAGSQAWISAFEDLSATLTDHLTDLQS